LSRGVEGRPEGECPGFAEETTMVKCAGPLALATAVAVLALGCVRGLGSPTPPAADRIYIAKPMSAPVGLTSSETTTTVLWRDIGIYSVSGRGRVAGPRYEMTSYETQAECEAAQRAAMAEEAASRVGPTTEQLPDGIKTWDTDRQHYTTFRYLCQLGVVSPTPIR
jgi:hypothetical protein